MMPPPPPPPLPQGKKRFFQCRQCKYRDACVTAFPRFDCARCGARNWTRCAMHEARVAPAPGDALLLRGHEHGHAHFLALAAAP